MFLEVVTYYFLFPHYKWIQINVMLLASLSILEMCSLPSWAAEHCEAAIVISAQQTPNTLPSEAGEERTVDPNSDRISNKVDILKSIYLFCVWEDKKCISYLNSLKFQHILCQLGKSAVKNNKGWKRTEADRNRRWLFCIKLFGDNSLKRWHFEQKPSRRDLDSPVESHTLIPRH